VTPDFTEQSLVFALVIGHKSPDTDSVVSAMMFSQIMQQVCLIPSLAGYRFQPCVTGPLNPETRYVLNRFSVDCPALVVSLEKDQPVFLVDHADYDQAVDGLKQAQILGVIDHHRVGGISTPGPIFARSEPIGSTCSLLAKMAYEQGFEPDRQQASLLLCGLVSDTLNLTSPTTTAEDRRLAQDLCRLSGISVQELADGLFAAKSDISSLTSAELVAKDYKAFDSGRTVFGFGVWETTKPETVFARRHEILEALKAKKAHDGLNLIFFAVVDIAKSESFLLIVGPEEQQIAQSVYGTAAENGLVPLPGVISRKKQMLPPLISFLKARAETRH